MNPQPARKQIKAVIDTFLVLCQANRNYICDFLRLLFII